LHPREPLSLDDPGDARVSAAIGNGLCAAIGDVALVAGRFTERPDEAVEPRRLPSCGAGGLGAFGETDIAGLLALFADLRGGAGAGGAELALGVELARVLGEVIAGRLARPGVDAGAFAPGLCGGPIGGAELGRCAVLLERPLERPMIMSGFRERPRSAIGSAVSIGSADLTLQIGNIIP